MSSDENERAGIAFLDLSFFPPSLGEDRGVDVILRRKAGDWLEIGD